MRRMNRIGKVIGMGMVAVLFLGGIEAEAAAKPNVRLLKLHHVKNLDKKNTGGNEALEFEYRYWDHGAASHKELWSRRGEIFVFVWKNDGAAVTGEAIFSYRQAHTQDAVKIIRMPIKNATGTHRCVIPITGENYFKDGPPRSWLFEIKRENGEVHLTEKSFIW